MSCLLPILLELPLSLFGKLNQTLYQSLWKVMPTVTYISLMTRMWFIILNLFLNPAWSICWAVKCGLKALIYDDGVFLGFFLTYKPSFCSKDNLFCGSLSMFIFLLNIMKICFLLSLVPQLVCYHFHFYLLQGLLHFEVSCRMLISFIF